MQQRLTNVNFQNKIYWKIKKPLEHWLILTSHWEMSLTSDQVDNVLFWQE